MSRINLNSIELNHFCVLNKAVVFRYLKKKHLKHHSRHLFDLVIFIESNPDVNSLSANPTKWSTTLKQFVGNFLELKGLEF